MSGLEHRYHVSRVDGKEKPEAKYFVLDPANDPAAYYALVEYADVTNNKELASDITNWLNEIGEPERWI